MNARLRVTLIMFGLIAGAAIAESPSTAVHQGNALYGQGKFGDAVKKYDQAAGVDPSLLESLYDKANGCYRLDDLAGAADLYKSVAAQSRDAGLVEKAKYNLGNCAFRQALKLKDSDPQKALEGIKAGIGSWRQVLDMDPQNQNAARNIEVARLTMKDIIEQQKQKQQDPNKSQKNDQKNQDPNQQNQNQQQNQQGKQDPNQQNQQQIKKEQSKQESDPNQSQKQQKKMQQDPNKIQDPNKKQQQQKEQKSSEPNKPEDKKQEAQQQQQKDQQEISAPDATAQEILDREQQDRKQREITRQGKLQPVDKDW